MAFLFLPSQYRNFPKRIIRELYKKYNWQREKKAALARPTQKLLFCQKSVAMLRDYPDIKVDVIIANKLNAQDHIKEDPNKLYNYMSSLVVPDYMAGISEATFMPDKRSVKVESGSSLVDYLQIKLWFECKYKTKLHNNPLESHESYNLQFVDWIAHCVWGHFEDSESQPFNILQPHIKIRRLFFPS